MTETRAKPAPSGIGRTVVGFLEYALMFTVIIECNSLFHYSENYRATTLEVVATVFGIGLAAVLAAVYARRYRQELRADLKRNWPLWAALLAGVFLFLAVNVMRIGGENALRKYALSFVLFLPAALLLCRLCRIAGRPNALFYKHADLVCVLAVCNLIVFAAVTLRPEVIRTQLLRTRWSDLGYLTELCNYLDLCCVAMGETRTIAGFTIYRNIGFFTEPLMYCIPLVTALFTEMFLRPREDRRVWKWVVLLLAIFSSQATLGMLLGAAAVGLKFLESGTLRKRWYLPVIALGMVALAVAALLWQKTTQGGNSIAHHTAHYTAAFKAFLSSPLIGVGYMREAEILRYVPSAYALRNQGLSNSIAVVLGEGGVLLSLLCLLPFFLGLALFRSKTGRSAAFWTLGPLGLYCLTVFHFHLLLMLFMAFGYARLELVPGEEKGRKLRLAEEEDAPCSGEGLTGPERAGRLVFLLLGCAAAAALFLSGGFWQALSRRLAFYQLYLGQSAWKVYFAALFLILAALVIRFALRAWGDGRGGRWLPETVWFLLYTAVWAAAYPVLWSGAASVLDRANPFGDLFETGALALLYFGGVGAGWLLIRLYRRSKKRFAVGTAAAVLVLAGIGAGSFLLISRTDVQTAEIAPAVELAASAGTVYPNELPAAAKRALPALTLSPARDGAFAAREKTSVLADHDRDLRDLIDAGFAVTELSPAYVLYTNDDAVMDRLRGEGYTFYRYYPYPRSPEQEAAAVLRSGSYTLTAQLEKEPEKDPPHVPVCTLRITAYYGKNRVAEQTVYADDFDPEGKCSVSLPFAAGDWEGMAYTAEPTGETALRGTTLTLRETPAYLTETTRDGRRLPIREAYLTLTGEPFTLDQGYAAVETSYDRAGRVLRQAYFGGDGLPVRTASGYAAFTRTYDRRGRLSREAYFDENGSLCLLPQGYAAFERIYSRNGTLRTLRYLDAGDRPAMTAMGYAAIEYGYNSRRQATELSYWDETGARVLLPQGYWMEQRVYDESGNAVVQRYFGTAGEPVMITKGYAELHREFNAARKPVTERYCGTDGQPIALANGTAELRIEYDAQGNEIARRRYDLEGNEILPD